MAATLLIGNLALFSDSISPRAHLPDRTKSCVSVSDTTAQIPSRSLKREQNPIHFVLSSVSKSNSDGPVDPAKNRSRGGKWKVGATGESSESSALDDNNGDEEEWWKEWEEDLKRTVKEMEEMNELEKTAEELQSQEGDGDETEEEKRERVRRELEKVAKEQAERRATAQLMFELGQKAYGKGMYSRAIEFLEASLTIIPRPTLLGGEIQIWLAMAYEANKRHKDCIDLYKQLENDHPSVSIRRQAAELRYILQAPKLKISKDEMVTIPLIGSSYDWYAGTWSDKYKDQEARKKTATAANPLPPSRNFFGDFILLRPPSGWQRNRNLWAIVTLWFCLVGTALYLQR